MFVHFVKSFQPNSKCKIFQNTFLRFLERDIGEDNVAAILQLQMNQNKLKDHKVITMNWKYLRTTFPS